MMKIALNTSVLLFLLCSGHASAQNQTSIDVPLTTKADSISYAFGMSIGGDLKNRGVTELNPVVLADAIRTLVSGGSAKFSIEQQNQLVTQALTEGAERQHAGAIHAAKAYLEENKTKPNVQTTATGLQYEVIRAGQEGGNPGLTDKVTVHYKGTLTNGNQFDSSYDRGEPASFGLNRVIRGWQEGLQLMTPGAHYRFVIPYELAYGERGSGAHVPPYSVLIFDVELLGVESVQ